MYLPVNVGEDAIAELKSPNTFAVTINNARIGFKLISSKIFLALTFYLLYFRLIQ